MKTLFASTLAGSARPLDEADRVLPGGEKTMINEQERRILQELERRTEQADPEFARRLAEGVSASRWSVRRVVTSTPMLLLVAVLSALAFVLNLGVLGGALLVWVLLGIVSRVDSSRGRATRWMQQWLKGSGSAKE